MNLVPRRVASFVEYLLRGYGQMFLCNHRTSGGLFLIGLTIASPRNAALSALGAAIVTLVGMCFARGTTELRNGLFGVNGVLLGYAWIFFPEISFSLAVILSAAGAVFVGLVLAGCLAVCARRKWHIAFFSMPYVLAAWLTLIGLYWNRSDDPRMLAGWTALAERNLALAEASFSAVESTDKRVAAFQHSGLGWVAFHQANYATARDHFQQAAELAPEMSDPHDGLGWCAFRMAQWEKADNSFGESLQRDSATTDSWLGRGWLALREERIADAETYFERAAWLSPLCADAFRGLTQCYAANDNEGAVEWGRWWSGLIDRHLGTRHQFTSGRQVLCWLLFALGIVWHSRISFLAAGGAIAWCLFGAKWFPELATTFGDLHFIFNLIAAFIAIAGLYLKRNGVLFGWLIVVTCVMTLSWHGCSGRLGEIGLPLLCLPVNVALAATTFVFGWFPNQWPKRQAIPFELALSSPEAVGLWLKKCDLAETCWEKIAAARRRLLE